MRYTRPPVDQKILETLPHNERGSIRSKQREELQPWPLKQTVEAQQVMLWRVVARPGSLPEVKLEAAAYALNTLAKDHLNMLTKSQQERDAAYTAGIKSIRR